MLTSARRYLVDLAFSHPHVLQLHPLSKKYIKLKCVPLSHLIPIPKSQICHHHARVLTTPSRPPRAPPPYSETQLLQDTTRLFHIQSPQRALLPKPHPDALTSTQPLLQNLASEKPCLQQLSVPRPRRMVRRLRSAAAKMPRTSWLIHRP